MKRTEWHQNVVSLKQQIIAGNLNTAPASHHVGLLLVYARA